MATQDISTSFNLDSRSSAGQFKKWLKTVPDMARITVQHTPGDRPFDASQDKITARWTQSVDERD